MRGVILKEGEFIRIKGRLTMMTEFPSSRRGGSTWTEKNPVILLGKCKHDPINKVWYKGFFGKGRTYFKGRVVCSKCAHIIKWGKEKPSTKLEDSNG